MALALVALPLRSQAGKHRIVLLLRDMHMADEEKMRTPE